MSLAGEDTIEERPKDERSISKADCRSNGTESEDLKPTIIVEGTPNNEQNAASVPQQGTIPYTAFTTTERRTITWLIGWSMFFSPFTANIYFPCLQQLQDAVGVDSTLINLTIMTYLIIQAIAPAICGDLADTIGRRPVYLITFSK
jgi:hypothetical protein